MQVRVDATLYGEDAKGVTTTYKVKAHIEALGMWLNGIKVVVFHEGTGECKVYKPSYWNPYKKKFDSDIDFDTSCYFWNLIAIACIEAVEKSKHIILKQVEDS